MGSSKCGNAAGEELPGSLSSKSRSVSPGKWKLNLRFILLAAAVLGVRWPARGSRGHIHRSCGGCFVSVKETLVSFFSLMCEEQQDRPGRGGLFSQQRPKPCEPQGEVRAARDAEWGRRLRHETRAPGSNGATPT